MLDDDKRFFPAYDAVLLYRLDLPRALSQIMECAEAPRRRNYTARMTAMNAEAELDGQAIQGIAHDFVAGTGARRLQQHSAASDHFWVCFSDPI